MAASPGVADMDGDAGGNELGLARLERERVVEAGHQVEAGGALGAVTRQREFIADARVEDFEFDSWHEISQRYVE